MRYVFDTNIILHYLRKSELSRQVDAQFNPTALDHEPFVPVVVRGELESLALQNQWSVPRRRSVEAFLNQLISVEINAEDVLLRYAEIDAFSQGKLPGRPLGTSARNLGKNDLWIAAITSVLNATLLTTDADFEHLDEVFLTLGRLKT